MARWLKVERNITEKKFRQKRNGQRRDFRQLQKYRLLRTFVHTITFKFYPSLILHFKLSSESVSQIYRDNEEWMNPNHNCNEEKSSITMMEEEWIKFFVSLPLHGIRIMDTAWPSSSVVWKLCWCGMVVVFFVVCWVVGMGWTWCAKRLGWDVSESYISAEKPVTLTHTKCHCAVAQSWPNFTLALTFIPSCGLALSFSFTHMMFFFTLAPSAFKVNKVKW